MNQVETSDANAFPMSRTCPFDPPPRYAELRSTQPVSRVSLFGGKTAWLVTRHEDVRQVLSDPRMSSDRNREGFPRLVPGGVPAFLKQPMIGMDAPEHASARRAVLGEFTVRRIQALRPRIQEIVDECVDEVLAGAKPVDLVQNLSLPVPSLVICELLGVPYAEHDFFQQRTKWLVRRSASAEQRSRAVQEIHSYLDGLVSAKEQEPTDDLLGRQIVKSREDGDSDHEALVSLAFMLLVAGHETTANMLSLGIAVLLENPEQLAAIVADPDKTPAAVEELLRYFSVVETATSRTAMADIEVGDVLIREGEGVIALTPAANRDPAAFEAPDELDIERGSRQHVAFGFGPHQCLGQNLARLELRIVFDTLFHRIPTVRLANSVEELRFKDDASIYGLHELPVTW